DDLGKDSQRVQDGEVRNGEQPVHQGSPVGHLLRWVERERRRIRGRRTSRRFHRDTLFRRVVAECTPTPAGCRGSHSATPGRLTTSWVVKRPGVAENVSM